MRIEGNLETYEFTDLLQWLAQGGKSGLLTIGNGEVEYQLGFDRGSIDMSASTDPAERLDSYLCDKGLIDAETLARGERLREATQMMSGQVLVTLGAVTEEQLAEALRERAERHLGELLSWQQGSFVFEGGERPASTMVRIHLDVTKLLLECMHKLDQGDVADPPTPTATFKVAGLDGSATQAIDGLALAEVLDPAAAPAPSEAPAPESSDHLDAAPHYAVMAQGPSTLRRSAPYALVLLLSFAVGGFHLANIEASARAAEIIPGGQPIRFAQTPVPLPGPEPAQPPAADPAVAEADSSAAALQQRYEAELAELRRELEQARRLAEPPAQQSLALEPGAADAKSELAAEHAANPPARALERPPVTAPAEAVAAQPPAVDLPPARSTGLPGVAAKKHRPADTGEPAAVGLPTDPPAATAPRFELVNPKLVARPAPTYPALAQRHRRGATVTVRVLVGVDGRVEDVERIGAKAGMGFDRAAEDAARGSVWEPGSRAGEPTPMWADLRFEFQP